MEKRILLFVLVGVALVSGVAGLGLYSFGSAASFLKLAQLSSVIEQNIALRRQNQGSVQNQHEIVSVAREDWNADNIVAKVFSSYPLNIKSRLYINKGEEDGVVSGSGAIAFDSFFVGIVDRVAVSQSSIITIFDSGFSLPVRIGAEEVDGLLQGGLAPRITLIDKNKIIHAGDSIISASRELPYGLLVGSVESVHEDSSGAFFEARMVVPYVVSDIKTVTIVSSHELPEE